MLSDIVIAQAAKMLPIAKVAEKLGLTDEDLIPYCLLYTSDAADEL